MTSLSPDELSIIEQFNRLNNAQQQRVLDVLQQSAPPTTPFDVEAWLAKVEQIRASMNPPYILDELMEVLDDVRGENNGDQG